MLGKLCQSNSRKSTEPNKQKIGIKRKKQNNSGRYTPP